MQRITTKLVMDMVTNRVLEREAYDYAGPVALCKHEEEKALAKSQTDFYNTLRGMYATQFGKQSAIYAALEKAFTPLLAGTTGYTAAREAALRTGATEDITGQFQSAARNIQERAFALGGRELPSGALLAQLSGLELGRAQTEAGAQRSITMQNEALKQENMWKAANVLGGTASGYNPLGYAGAALSGGEGAAKTTQSAYQSIWSRVLAGLAGGAGNAFFKSMFPPKDGSGLGDVDSAASTDTNWGGGGAF